MSDVGGTLPLVTISDDQPNKMVLLDELKRLYHFEPGDQLDRMHGFPDVTITIRHVDAERDDIVVQTVIHANRTDVAGMLENAG